MKIIPIIQARTNSSRYYAKILAPFFNGLTTLDYILGSLNSLPIEPAIIATSDNHHDDNLFKIYSPKTEVFRGSEDNVLSRYTEIIKNHQPDYIVRVCADNPLILSDGLQFLIEQIKHNPDLDYLSFQTGAKPAMKIAAGIFVELVKADALIEVSKQAKKLDVEHVTISLYDDGANNFRLFEFEKAFFPLPEQMRMTIDTRSDFEIVDNVLQRLQIAPPFQSDQLKKVLQFLKNEGLLADMSRENQKPSNSKNYKN